MCGGPKSRVRPRLGAAWVAGLEQEGKLSGPDARISDRSERGGVRTMRREWASRLPGIAVPGALGDQARPTIQECAVRPDWPLAGPGEGLVESGRFRGKGRSRDGAREVGSRIRLQDEGADDGKDAQGTQSRKAVLAPTNPAPELRCGVGKEIALQAEVGFAVAVTIRFVVHESVGF